MLEYVTTNKAVYDFEGFRKQMFQKVLKVLFFTQFTFVSEN